VRSRFFGSVLVAAIVMAAWSLDPRPAVVAQTGGGSQMKTAGGCPTVNSQAFHRCALEKVTTFKPALTKDGTPDFQGYWEGSPTSDAVDYTLEGVEASNPETKRPIMPWEVGPSLIVDPPDGKIPYQPWAAAIGRKQLNFAKYIDPRTACGSGGLSRLMQYDFQILQHRDYIAMLVEDHHAYRLIAMNGRPHPRPDIKMYNGDATGRWEGNTLVIDVTNLNGHNWLDDSGNFYTDAAHLVERLTLIDADTIHYAITFEDPKAYTRPWTVVWPLRRNEDPNYEHIEEACWEGERDLPSFLKLGYRFYWGEPWRSR
jgi:hypothetical protein